MLKDYEKLYSKKLHYLATKYLKQLNCNHITSIPWKYEELKSRMLCVKNSWNSIAIAC
jgi:hypothetical protein